MRKHSCGIDGRQDEREKRLRWFGHDKKKKTLKTVKRRLQKRGKKVQNRNSLM